MMVWLTIPGEPQGKGRHRAVRRGDQIATYTPRKTKDYEDEVQFCYRQAYGDRMAFAVDEPISATIIAAFGIPKSTSKRRKDEKKSWAEQAKMRANKTASTYNNYILENSFVWEDNIPSDINYKLEYID